MFKFIKLIFTLSLVFSLGFTSVLYADPTNNPGKGNAKNFGAPGKGQAKKANKNTLAKTKKPKFSTKSRALITNYFNANPKAVTGLPPGIAMNLARGKPLPPGIKKVFLPSDLLSSLPNYPGYEYLAVGKDVLLVDKNSEIIADILSNVLK